MKIEVLFPEVCNLCGELTNISYLKQCCPTIEVVETDLHTRPRFLDEEVALVYIGSATERGLQLVIDALRPYLSEIKTKIEAGQFILATGNAPDALCEAVESDKADTFQGLGILPGTVRYRMMARHNSFYLGKWDDMDVVGFKSLFGFTYDSTASAWFTTTRGVGRDGKDGTPDGFRCQELYATHLIGPLLVLNPPLARWVLRKIGAPETLAFDEAITAAYEKRVAEFAEPHRNYMY